MSNPGSDDFLDDIHEDKRYDELSHPDLVRKLKAQDQKIADLKEAITPFILHGRALGVMERDDSLTVVSQKGVSALCIGAFRSLMEAMPFEELRQ